MSGTTTGTDAYAAGNNSQANGDYATAIGAYAVATGAYATALGAASAASAGNATALGSNSAAAAVDATAVGPSAYAEGVGAVSVGSNAYAGRPNSVVFGTNANDWGRDNFTVLNNVSYPGHSNRLVGLQTLNASTNSTAPKRLTADFGAPNGHNTLPLRDGSILAVVSSLLIGRRASGSANVMMTLPPGTLIARGTGPGTVLVCSGVGNVFADVNPLAFTLIGGISGVAPPVATLYGDTTLGSLNVQVVPPTADVWEWSLSLLVHELTG